MKNVQNPTPKLSAGNGKHQQDELLDNLFDKFSEAANLLYEQRTTNNEHYECFPQTNMKYYENKERKISALNSLRLQNERSQINQNR